MGPDFLSAPEYAEILAYNRPGYLLAAVSEPLNLAILVIWVGLLVRPFYRWSEAVSGWCAARAPAPLRNSSLARVLGRLWGGPGWGTALLYTAICSAFLALVTLPAAIWFGFLHDRAHGLFHASGWVFARDTVLHFLQVLWVRLLLAFGLYALARRLRRWWLVLGGVCAVLLLGMATLDPFRASREVPHHRLPPGQLEEKIRALLARDEVPFSQVTVVESSRHTSKADALFTGEGPTRQVLLSDTFLAGFSEPEILAAVAHEAGHAHENPWPGRLLAALALVAFLFGIDRLLRLAHRRRWFGATEYADIRTLPLLTVLMYLLISVVQPVSAYVSRQRELEADRHAVELTGDPAAFRALLEQLARVNKMDPWPPEWVVWRGLNHPPIGERITQLDALRR